MLYAYRYGSGSVIMYWRVVLELRGRGLSGSFPGTLNVQDRGSEITFVE